jgi:hypothetical protein
VEKECKDGSEIKRFFHPAIDDERYLIIHIDTDVSQDYGIAAVTSSKAAMAGLREQVIAKVKSWMSHYTPGGPIFYGIAIKSIDAWVLAIFDGNKDETGLLHHPKDRLDKAINSKISERERKKLSAKKTFDRYSQLSKDFRKGKNLKKYAEQNESLRLFMEGLKAHFIGQILLALQQKTKKE